MSSPLTPDSWPSLDSLLERALDCPPEERAAFLRVACADDPEKLRLLEELLAGCEKPAPFLETPAFEHFVDLIEPGGTPSPQVPPILADRYRIERELGRGGMSIVYLADDTRHDRQVAVKVMNAAVTVAVTQERFHSEIRIAARLTHPHIVGLHDSGEADGLLFYVMPFIDGESLRARLRREPQLPVEEALQIAGVVAGALAYAHDHHIVHRDIKPENILFESGHAVVCDFGIAHALEESGIARLSDTGVGIGTPPYMSPEQVMADPHIDHRSDIYSLGCVLYEMLAGRPPFVGATREHVTAQHLSSPPPPIRLYRQGVPPGLERAVMNALEKAPANRFTKASEFAAALAEYRVDAGGSSIWQLVKRRATKRTLARAALGFAIASALITVPAGPAWIAPATGVTDVDVDSLKYLVLPPPETPAGQSLRLDVTETVRGGLLRWTGVRVVDATELGSALDGRFPASLSDRNVLDVARSLKAGRVVRLRLTQSDDSLDLQASLVDTRGNTPLTSKRVRLVPGESHTVQAVAALADSVLFPDPAPVRALPAVGTRSRPARQAYVNAHRALEQWDLGVADSQLREAINVDPSFAQALLWLAQVRSWMGEPDARWSSAADRAEAASQTLLPRERVQAQALASLSRGDVGRACPLWAQLAQVGPSDYANWYSWAICLRRDSVVLRDPRSPSRWRFRTSYGDVLRALEHALQLHPAIYRSYRGSSFEQLRGILMTRSNSIRQGRAPPDTNRFWAHPTWEGDSLAFVTWPAEFSATKAAIRSRTVDAAIIHQRDKFYGLASSWRSAFPDSADAVEAVAVALDLLGNPSALDTLRLASRLARDPDDRFRILTLEVWMQLRYSLPGDLAGIRAARRLADSLVIGRRPNDVSEAKQLASLAALLGRADLAATLSRIAQASSAPPALTQTAPALLAFAALGGTRDSLAILEPRVASAIDRNLVGAERNLAMSEWLVRSAWLAVPEHQFKSLQSRPWKSQYGELLSAWEARDINHARRVLNKKRDARTQGSIHSAEITMDGLYFEAAVLASLGDDKGATAWLDPTLDSLSLAEPLALTDIALAGPLVRAMALRADLANRAGDKATARLWARAVTELWGAADGFLQPTVRRMAALAL